jgi:hypothetical protein
MEPALEWRERALDQELRANAWRAAERILAYVCSARERVGGDRFAAEQATRTMFCENAAAFWTWLGRRRWFARVKFAILEIDDGDLFDQLVFVALELLLHDSPEPFGNEQQSFNLRM